MWMNDAPSDQRCDRLIAVAEEVHMKTIELVHQSGQSMWLDFISRSLITSGQLKLMVEQGWTDWCHQ